MGQITKGWPVRRIGECRQKKASSTALNYSTYAIPIYVTVFRISLGASRRLGLEKKASRSIVNFQLLPPPENNGRGFSEI